MRQWQIVGIGLAIPLAVVVLCVLGNMRAESGRVDSRIPIKPAPAPQHIVDDAAAAESLEVTPEASALERIWSGPLPWFMAAMVGAFLLYFTPALIAGMRKHHNATAIFMLNLFLGWTGMGWVGALVWAFTSPPPAPKAAP